jgi:hypothetical protein
MKNLIEFVYSCEVNFYNYIQTRNLEKLIEGLKRVEYLIKNAGYGTDSGSICFKFSDDDTLITTVDDLINDLSLPASHSNHKLMVEKITNAVDLNGELKVFFS